MNEPVQLLLFYPSDMKSNKPIWHYWKESLGMWIWKPPKSQTKE